MIRWMLGWILDGSWIDFWWILGPSWEASWHQVDTKIQKIRVPRGGQKMDGKKVMQVSAGATGGKRCRGGGPLRVLRTQTQRDQRDKPWGTLQALAPKARGRY